MVRLIKEGSWNTDFLHEVIWKLEDIFSDFGIESEYFNFFLDSDGDFGKFEMRLYVNDRQLELGKLEVRYYGEDGKFDKVVVHFDLSKEAERFCGKDFYRWATDDFHEGWDELYSYVTVTASKIIDCYKDWYGITDPIEDEEFDESIKHNKRRMKEARIGRTKEVKVLQGNWGYGWDDLCEYDKYDNGECRADLKSYKENDPSARYRVIFRRVPNKDYVPTED